MNKMNIISGSKLEILNAFLKNPEMQATFLDLRLKVSKFSETDIRNSLQDLKKSHILLVNFKRGRPKGGCRTEVYTISKDWEIFEKLCDIYLNNNCRIFLKSKYLNELAASRGLINVFNQLKEKFYDDNFKRVASNALLKRPAIIREYKNHPNILKEIPDSLIKGIPITNFNDEDIIDILSILDPLSSIKFYRKNIGDTYIKFYREFSNKNIYISETIKRFVDLDIMLSPLTSYPLDDPIYILFRRPFERIYSNAFILDPRDRYRFISRARLVYTHFAEIISSGINTLRANEINDLDYYFFDLECKRRYKLVDESYFRQYQPLIEYRTKRLNYLISMQNNLETLVKLSIYHWNVAAYRFDFICNRLRKDLLLNYRRKYYIFEKDGDTQIIDLQSGKLIMHSEELIGNVSLLSGLEDPFKRLLPCEVFGVDMNRKPITYEDILEEVKSKIIEQKLFRLGLL